MTLTKLREALESCPIIGIAEPTAHFRKRQDQWLNGPYREALALLSDNMVLVRRSDLEAAKISLGSRHTFSVALRILKRLTANPQDQSHG